MAIEFKDGITSVADVANVDAAIAVTDSTAVELLPENEMRLYIFIQVKDADIWLRFLPASTDPTAKKGIFIPCDGGYEFPANFALRSADISAIAEFGTAQVYVTEA